MLYQARGVTKETGAAANYARRGCDGGVASACRLLGIQTELGDGVTKNLSDAAGLFRKACNGNDVIGCQYLADFYVWGEGVPKDLGQARLYYRKALSLAPTSQQRAEIEKSLAALGPN